MSSDAPITAIPNPLQRQASFAVPPALEAAIDEWITHYPVKRSASLMVLHGLQEHFGWLSQEAVEWTARKLGLQPIAIYELVTFYPMFRQKPAGRRHIKVCRTLCCALVGGMQVCEEFRRQFAGDPESASADGDVTVEFVECLASCGSGPVVMIDEELHERVDVARARELCEQIKAEVAAGAGK